MITGFYGKAINIVSPHGDTDFLWVITLRFDYDFLFSPQAIFSGAVNFRIYLNNSSY
ncbi:hypothetical protein A33Q_4128 [Indibacter alkaliphilus LW1]|uniref:Uncharacterized protein n=1 Tax=Indibacter alkaliphilus (strain CCUG 57479 / KCTC 22604 / LW1) TaxID=1189612 RepID=S2D4R0_INDAL|nr:hypothetical protein A33Q_4128 [Indibacter alkaliphilus LW1]